MSLNTSNISITVDESTGMLLLDCPYHMNAMVKSLPVRRWNKRRRMWVAPAIWRNVEMIHSMVGFEPDHAAAEVMSRVMNDRRSVTIQSGFPEDFDYKHPPFQFQQEVLDKSHGIPYAYFMDMGTGKSKVTIDRMTAYYKAKKIDRVIIVCLKSARQVWPRELKTHCSVDYGVHLLHTEFQFKEFMKDDKEFKWLIVGVETFSQGKKWELSIDFLRAARYGCGFAVDEAHTIINSTSIRSKRLFDISMSCVRETRAVLTGTPILKGPENLFGLFKILDPEILGFPDPYSFQTRYCIKGGFEGRQIVSYQNLNELYALLRNNLYQITKEEALPHLPPKLYEMREIEMTKDQRRYYDQMKKQEFYETDVGTMTVSMILTKMLRLQQAANGYLAVHPDGDISKTPVLQRIPGKNPKIEAILDITEEVSGKTIVWTVYRQELQDIVDALENKYGAGCAVQYHGLDKHFTEEDRIRAVDDFQEDPKVRFFVSTVQSGSLGLTLTAATTVIYYANTFHLNDRKQSEDRAHREGQENAVTYIDLLMEKSIDSLVLKAVKTKIGIAEAVRQALRVGPSGHLHIPLDEIDDKDIPF